MSDFCRSCGSSDHDTYPPGCDICLMSMDPKPSLTDEQGRWTPAGLEWMTREAHRRRVRTLGWDEAHVRYFPCGCRTDEAHDEARHLRNQLRAADALGWTHHEAAELDR